MLDAEAALTGRSRAGVGPAGRAGDRRGRRADARRPRLALRGRRAATRSCRWWPTCSGGGPSPRRPDVHHGATSQDMLDTALMLVASDVLRQAESHLEALADSLASLSDATRDAPLTGRTLTQQALPTTLGLRAAGWLDGVLDAVERLRACLPLPVSLGGPVGSLSTYRRGRGRRALGLRRRPGAVGPDGVLAHPADAAARRRPLAHGDRRELRDDRVRRARDGADRGRRGPRGHRRAVVVHAAQGQPHPVRAGGRRDQAAAGARLAAGGLRGLRAGPAARRLARRVATAARHAPVGWGGRGADRHARPRTGARPRRDGAQPGPARRRPRSGDLWVTEQTAGAGVWVDRVLARCDEVLG